MDLMTEGSREDFERFCHPEAVNREAAVEPPAARQPGPAGFWATAQWLRAAFSGLHFEIHEAVERDDLVVVHVTMSGRHTGDFVSFRPGTDTVDSVMPPTGKSFAVTQTHWFRTRDGMITEHWANRDDLAMGRPDGYPRRQDSSCAPPSPSAAPSSTRPDVPSPHPPGQPAPPGQLPPDRASPERTGSRVSLRQNALDPGFHRVPNGPERPDRNADGAGVI
jgi:predicted ester cyclase